MKILISETQEKNIQTKIINELLALNEAQLDNHHARELLHHKYKRAELDALVEKFMLEDPSLNESKICYYIRRFELIKDLHTRKKIEKSKVRDYTWDELVDFVDTRIPYYQETIVKKKHK